MTDGNLRRVVRAEFRRSQLRLDTGSGWARLSRSLSLCKSSRCRRLKLLVLLSSGFAVGGCAAIFHGSTRAVTVRSDPPGAAVRIGEEERPSPATFVLSTDRQEYTAMSSPRASNFARLRYAGLHTAGPWQSARSRDS